MTRLFGREVTPIADREVRKYKYDDSQEMFAHFQCNVGEGLQVFYFDYVNNVLSVDITTEDDMGGVDVQNYLRIDSQSIGEYEQRVWLLTKKHRKRILNRDRKTRLIARLKSILSFLKLYKYPEPERKLTSVGTPIGVEIISKDGMITTAKKDAFGEQIIEKMLRDGGRASINPRYGGSASINPRSEKMLDPFDGEKVSEIYDAFDEEK